MELVHVDLVDVSMPSGSWQNKLSIVVEVFIVVEVVVLEVDVVVEVVVRVVDVVVVVGHITCVCTMLLRAVIIGHPPVVRRHCFERKT